MAEFRRKEIRGNIYGKLQATGNHFRKNKRIKEEVKCLKCGWVHYVDRCCLITNRCGCRKCSHMTHGFNGTRFYQVWRNINQRCKSNRFKDYYGKGIRVEWNSFEEFKDDMYESYLAHVEKYGEKKTSIDRINYDGNYCKENCRWATNIEQANNTRRNVGVRQFARETGIPRNRVVYWYYYKGLSLEQIREKFI